MTENEYFLNLVKLTILWASSSFVMYVVMFLNKTTEGSLFLNSYLEAIANLVAVLTGSLIYGWLQLKISFILSYSITLVGAFFVFMFQ